MLIRIRRQILDINKAKMYHISIVKTKEVETLTEWNGNNNWRLDELTSSVFFFLLALSFSLCLSLSFFVSHSFSRSRFVYFNDRFYSSFSSSYVEPTTFVSHAWSSQNETCYIMAKESIRGWCFRQVIWNFKHN